MFFDEKGLASDILEANGSLECKQLARNIASYDAKSWNTYAKELCEPGIHAKFEQNATLMQLLLSTGTKKLAEACYD